MKKTSDIIYRISVNFMMYGCLLLGFLLFLCGFLFTCFAQDMDTQQVLTAFDHPLVSILGLVVSLIGVTLVYRFISPKAAERNGLLLKLLLLWYLVGGVILVLFSRTVPAADAMSVYTCAEQLALGNTGVIHPTDSYLSYYPQQVGLMGYYEILIRLWKLLPTDFPAYHILKVINIFWAQILLYFQYKSIQLLFRNNRADTIYLLISFINLPLLLYTSFVYGEIPSFALFSIGVWAFIKLLTESKGKRHSILPIAICVLSFAASVALRKNTLIPMIGVIIVSLLTALRRRSAKLALLGILFLLVSTFTLPCIQSYYEHRANARLSSGVPAISYFAMGMQEASRGAGWYNGFNFYTYQDTGMDTEATAIISKEQISRRIEEFTENPGYAASFYGRKFLSQWCDGSYASRQATLATLGGRSQFFWDIYQGRYSQLFIGLCNILQNIIYLGFLLWAIHIFRDRKARQTELYLYLFAIIVMGGLLFHMIWEANSRYILPYGLLLIPYASQGIALLSEHLSFKVHALFKKSSEKKN
ncbi:MAG: hypothetical protein IJ335_11530 [Lachnospiraceae bacterium]|nr:hypothetical protein [Lachnospiraceae bacterium]